MVTVRQIAVVSLYLLAMINPLSKISVLSAMEEHSRRDLVHAVRRSSLIAAAILLGTMIFGNVILHGVFHVDLHSLRVSGGVVLLWVGFNALRKGVFFEQSTAQKFGDLAIVPLACPMIAGPATIVAVATLVAREGRFIPAAAVIIAIAVNAILMLSADFIGGILKRFNILGALIRITGLVVMTIGVQMVLDGLSVWVGTLAPAATQPMG